MLQEMEKQLTSVNILVDGSALNTLGCLFGRLRFQTLADIAKATVIHGALKGVALPPEAKSVSVNSRLKKEMGLNKHVIAVLGVPVSVSSLASLSALSA
jgi:hypothetical protein